MAQHRRRHNPKSSSGSTGHFLIGALIGAALLATELYIQSKLPEQLDLPFQIAGWIIPGLGAYLFTGASGLFGALVVQGYMAIQSYKGNLS